MGREGAEGREGRGVIGECQGSECQGSGASVQDRRRGEEVERRSYYSAVRVRWRVAGYPVHRDV